MDSPESMSNPHIEVQKLQELVRKLEQQNAILRKQKHPDLRQERNGVHEQVNKNNVNDYDLASDFDRIKLLDNFVLDDFEDVSYSDLPSEDDSWLYSSPTSSTSQSNEPLLSWVRQDFDHPNPDVASARRTLIHKLDEAARLKHSSSSPVISNNQALASKSEMVVSRSVDVANHTPLRALPQTRMTSPSGASKSALDTSTFTRPKKMLPRSHGDSNQQKEISYVPSPTDISEIKNLAKQQEESLRQSMTPVSLKALRAKHGLMDGENRNCHSPSRFDLDGSFISHHRGSLGSDHSTPPDSPHSSNQHLQIGHSFDSRVCRSLPNTPGMHTQSNNSSDSSLERHSATSDETNLAPESIRAPVSRLQQQNFGLTPKRSIPTGLAPGLSQQRTSGLPTPRQKMKTVSSTRTSLPTFQRLNMSSPKPPSSGGSEENWKDGCF